MEWKSIPAKRRYAVVVLMVLLAVALVGVIVFKQRESVTAKLTVINGIQVPPEPDPELNNATLAGIDSNGNGVRDDVERLIAKMYGNNEAKYREAFAFSKAEQAGIVNPNEKTADAYTKAVDCSTMTADELDPVTFALLNTPERGEAYAMANAGTSGVIGRTDCEGWEEEEISTKSSEVINGITVPPEPDPELNNATLAGIDSNGNGVRDDVERAIAEKSLTQEEFINGSSIARSIQLVLLEPNLTQERYDEIDIVLMCADISSKDISAEQLKPLVLNTQTRKNTYKDQIKNITGRFYSPEEECQNLENELLQSLETINGIQVPPEPNPELNNATLAGIDSNGNGVRDDVERLIAEKFGGTTDYQYAIASAKEFQNKLIRPTPATRDEALVQVARGLCALRGASRVVYQFGFGEATANTDKRKQVERAFNDVLIGYVPQELPPCSE